MTIRDKATYQVSQSNFVRPSHVGDATSGARMLHSYIPQEVVRIVAPVMKALGETKDPRVEQGVRELIQNLADLLAELSTADLNLSNLPAMYGTNLEDSSYLIEWLSPNYRVGFVIEADVKNSIWYLFSKSDSLDSNSWGLLTDRDKRVLLTHLVSFVATNS